MSQYRPYRRFPVQLKSLVCGVRFRPRLSVRDGGRGGGVVPGGWTVLGSSRSYPSYVGSTSPWPAVRYVECYWPLNYSIADFFPMFKDSLLRRFLIFGDNVGLCVWVDMSPCTINIACLKSYARKLRLKFLRFFSYTNLTVWTLGPWGFTCILTSLYWPCGLRLNKDHPRVCGSFWPLMT